MRRLGFTNIDEACDGRTALAKMRAKDYALVLSDSNMAPMSGRELLAHELTHVMQQNGDGIRRKMTVSEPGDAHEIEADQMARVLMQQEYTPSIDRQVVPPQEEEEQQPIAAKRATDLVRRQPEAPTSQEEEEKKKMLLTKVDTTVVSCREYPGEAGG